MKPVPQPSTTALFDKVSPNLIVRCGNCGWHGKAAKTLPIQDLEERITPGEEVPVGECPECGCLCHLVKEQPSGEAVEKNNADYT